MNSPARLLTIALSIQLILAFFCPPIPFGERSVFISDLWLFFWAFSFGFHFLLTSPERKSLAVPAALSFLAIHLVYLHGFARPNLTPFFAQYIDSPKNDAFSFVREGVVAFRFWSWIFAALVIRRSIPNSVALTRVLAMCTFIASLIILIAALIPSVSIYLGNLYGYQPFVSPWADRIYGVFRSPIEGSVTLCLSFLILLKESHWGSKALRFACLTFIFLAVLLTKTLTAPASVVIALLISYRRKIIHSHKKVWAGLTAAALFGFIFATQNPEFYVAKRENFLFRLKPWTVYWDLALNHVDVLLFGSGFIPHFADNIYVFLFGRGGLLLLGAALFAFANWWKKEGKFLSPLAQAIPIFFLISGMTVDNLILRPVSFVLISAGISLLIRRVS